MASKNTTSQSSPTASHQLRQLLDVIKGAYQKTTSKKLRDAQVNLKKDLDKVIKGMRAVGLFDMCEQNCHLAYHACTFNCQGNEACLQTCSSNHDACLENCD